MSRGDPAPTARRRRRSTIVAGLVVVAGVTLIGDLGYRSSATSSDDTTAMTTMTVATMPPPTAPSRPFGPGPPPRRPPERHDTLDEADGVVPDGVTVFETHHPAVGKLDPALLDGLRHASTDAARDGITLYIDSGWRSPDYQEQLLREAIAEYGSADEAARWVATPYTSAHVSGNAVDVGPRAAAAWLSTHGAAYRLCQTYGNEPWHYELRPEALDHGCPPTYPDASQDPRMQQQ